MAMKILAIIRTIINGFLFLMAITWYVGKLKKYHHTKISCIPRNRIILAIASKE